MVCKSSLKPAKTTGKIDVTSGAGQIERYQNESGRNFFTRLHGGQITIGRDVEKPPRASRRAQFNLWSGQVGDRLSRRLWLLESESLCAEARRRTGLEDFGDPPVEPALSILVKSLEAEAELHPFGRFFMHIHLRELLRLDCV